MGKPQSKKTEVASKSRALTSPGSHVCWRRASYDDCRYKGKRGRRRCRVLPVHRIAESAVLTFGARKKAGMAKELRMSEEESLIPGLPDDVSMQCLARISHGFEGVMQCVSKRWRDAFQSKEIGQIRAREGLSGDWIFVYTSQQPAFGWQAYDPMADRWHPLPPAPDFTSDVGHCGFRCVILGCRLLVLGGGPGPYMEDVFFTPSAASQQPSNRVFCFDPFFRRWSELPSMKTSRVDFACAVINGRIIVAGGGSTSAESFNPETNTWEALPEMPKPLEDCRALVYNGKFQVLGFDTNELLFERLVLDAHEWKVESEAQEMPDLEDVDTAEMDGRLYGILKDALVVLDDNSREWRVLSALPFLEMTGREWQLSSSHPGFVGLNGRLYIFGGRDVEYDLISDEDVFVNFSTVKYCNPSAENPDYWHDARSLVDGGGAILACAALSQE